MLSNHILYGSTFVTIVATNALVSKLKKNYNVLVTRNMFLNNSLLQSFCVDFTQYTYKYCAKIINFCSLRVFLFVIADKNVPFDQPTIWLHFVRYNRVLVITEFVKTEFDCIWNILRMTKAPRRKSIALTDLHEFALKRYFSHSL